MNSKIKEESIIELAFRERDLWAWAMILSGGAVHDLPETGSLMKEICAI